MPTLDQTGATCAKASELLVRNSQEKPACLPYGLGKLEKRLLMTVVKGLKSDHAYTNSRDCGH